MNSSCSTNTIRSTHSEAESAGQRMQLDNLLTLRSQRKLDNVVIWFISNYGQALQGKSYGFIQNLIFGIILVNHKDTTLVLQQVVDYAWSSFLFLTFSKTFFVQCSFLFDHNVRIAFRNAKPICAEFENDRSCLSCFNFHFVGIALFWREKFDFVEFQEIGRLNISEFFLFIFYHIHGISKLCLHLCNLDTRCFITRESLSLCLNLFISKHGHHSTSNQIFFSVVFGFVSKFY